MRLSYLDCQQVLNILKSNDTISNVFWSTVKKACVQLSNRFIALLLSQKKRWWRKAPQWLSLIVLSSSLWADDAIYWQCTTSDENRQWESRSIYERAARGKTFDACKKQSATPARCKTDCEEFRHGLSTRPSWQCTALDDNAKSWVSQAYPQPDMAASDAKARCREHSIIPDSCFLNLLTCKNLSPH